MIDRYHPVDYVAADAFCTAVEYGIQEAAGLRCEVGMLARDCRQNLRRNLEMLERFAAYFDEFAVRCYANDCTDGTEVVLEDWRPTFDTTFEYERLGRPHLGGSRCSERTEALAGYRRRVQGMMEEADIYLILDPDLVCIDEQRLLAGFGDMLVGGFDAMAAQQLCFIPSVHPSRMINYDAFAWRPDWTWRQDDQRELSFHHDVRPAGAPAYRVNSAFGGACWYGPEYLFGRYDGVDQCEHVGLHRHLGGEMGVSPNMSVIGFIL